MNVCEDLRPSWDEYFLEIAVAVSARGDCTRSKVGAVIVDTDQVIVSTGFNGVARGEPGCLSGACPRGKLSHKEVLPYSDYSNCISNHAERNALLFATKALQSERVRSGTVYITRAPCRDCRGLLDKAQISRIVWPEGESLANSR